MKEKLFKVGTQATRSPSFLPQIPRTSWEENFLPRDFSEISVGGLNPPASSTRGWGLQRGVDPWGVFILQRFLTQEEREFSYSEFG